MAIRAKLLLVEIPANELKHYVGLPVVRVSGACQIVRFSSSAIFYTIDTNEELYTWINKGFYQFVAYIPTAEPDEKYQLLSTQDFERALEYYSKLFKRPTGELDIKKQYSQPLTKIYYGENGLVRLGTTPAIRPKVADASPKVSFKRIRIKL
jgi:hypothetical protein